MRCDIYNEGHGEGRGFSPTIVLFSALTTENRGPWRTPSLR
jgi:hypothetical protein